MRNLPLSYRNPPEEEEEPLRVTGSRAVAAALWYDEDCFTDYGLGSQLSGSTSSSSLNMSGFFEPQPLHPAGAQLPRLRGQPPLGGAQVWARPPSGRLQLRATGRRPYTLSPAKHAAAVRQRCTSQQPLAAAQAGSAQHLPAVRGANTSGTAVGAGASGRAKQQATPGTAMAQKTGHDTKRQLHHHHQQQQGQQQQGQQQQAAAPDERLGSCSNMQPVNPPAAITLPVLASPTAQPASSHWRQAPKAGAGTPGSSSSSSIEAGIRHFTSGAGQPGEVLTANPVRRDQPGSTTPAAQQAGLGAELLPDTVLDPYHLVLVPDSQAGPCCHVRITYYTVTEVWHGTPGDATPHAEWLRQQQMYDALRSLPAMQRWPLQVAFQRWARRTRRPAFQQAAAALSSPGLLRCHTPATAALAAVSEQLERLHSTRGQGLLWEKNPELPGRWHQMPAPERRTTPTLVQLLARLRPDQGSGATTLDELMRLRATSMAAASMQLATAHAKLLEMLQQLAVTLQKQQQEVAAVEVAAAAALAAKGPRKAGLPWNQAKPPSRQQQLRQLHVFLSRVASLVEVWSNTTLAAGTAAAVSSLCQGLLGPCPEVRLRLAPTTDLAGGAPLLAAAGGDGEAVGGRTEAEQVAWLERTEVVRLLPDPHQALASLCSQPRAVAECVSAAPLLSSELDIAAWHTTARTVAAATSRGASTSLLISATTGATGKGVFAATTTACGGLAQSSSMRRRCKRLSLLLEVASVAAAEAEVQQVLEAGLAHLAGLPEVVALGSRLRRHAWSVAQAPPPSSYAAQRLLSAALKAEAGTVPRPSQLLEYMVGAADWCCTTACSSAQATVGAWLLELGPSKAAHAPDAADAARKLLEELPALFKASYARLTADLGTAVGRLQQRPAALGAFLSWMAEVGPLLEAGAPGWTALLADVEAARRLAELMRAAPVKVVPGQLPGSLSASSPAAMTAQQLVAAAAACTADGPQRLAVARYAAGVRGAAGVVREEELTRGWLGFKDAARAAASHVQRGCQLHSDPAAQLLTEAKAQLLDWQQSLHELYTGHTSDATSAPAAASPPLGLQGLADELAGVWGAMGQLLGAARLMTHPDVVAAVEGVTAAHVACEAQLSTLQQLHSQVDAWRSAMATCYALPAAALVEQPEVATAALRALSLEAGVVQGSQGIGAAGFLPQDLALELLAWAPRWALLPQLLDTPLAARHLAALLLLALGHTACTSLPAPEGVGLSSDEGAGVQQSCGEAEGTPQEVPLGEVLQLLEGYGLRRSDPYTTSLAAWLGAACPGAPQGPEASQAAALELLAGLATPASSEGPVLGQCGVSLDATSLAGLISALAASPAHTAALGVVVEAAAAEAAATQQMVQLQARVEGLHLRLSGSRTQGCFLLEGTGQLLVELAEVVDAAAGLDLSGLAPEVVTAQQALLSQVEAAAAAVQELASCQDLLLALHSTLVTGWGAAAAPPAAARAWQQQLTNALLEWRTALLAAAQPGQPPMPPDQGGSLQPGQLRPQLQGDADIHQGGGAGVGGGAEQAGEPPLSSNTLELPGVARHPTWLRGAALVLVDHVQALLPVARDTRMALAQVWRSAAQVLAPSLMQACPALAWAAPEDLEQLAVAAPAGPQLLAALPCSVVAAVLPGVVDLMPTQGLLWDGPDSNAEEVPALLSSGLLGADPTTSTLLHGSQQVLDATAWGASTGLTALGTTDVLVTEVAGVVSLQGVDGEVLELGEPVVLPPRGHPGVWLQGLDDAARAALQQQARHALDSLPTLQVEVWAGRYCCQALLLVDAVVWTAALGNAVTGLSTGSNPQALRALCDAASLRLEALAKALRGNGTTTAGANWGGHSSSTTSDMGPSPLTLPRQDSAGQGWVGGGEGAQGSATDAVPTATCATDTGPRSPKGKRSQGAPSSAGQDHSNGKADQQQVVADDTTLAAKGVGSTSGRWAVPLPPPARRGLAALLAVGLAHREAAAALAAGGVTGPQDYSWLATPRYSWQATGPDVQPEAGGSADGSGALMVYLAHLAMPYGWHYQPQPADPLTNPLLCSGSARTLLAAAAALQVSPVVTLDMSSWGAGGTAAGGGPVRTFSCVGAKSRAASSAGVRLEVAAPVLPWRAGAGGWGHLATAASLAGLAGRRFAALQCSPDMTPESVTRWVTGVTQTRAWAGLAGLEALSKEALAQLLSEAALMQRASTQQQQQQQGVAGSSSMDAGGALFLEMPALVVPASCSSGSNSSSSSSSSCSGALGSSLGDALHLSGRVAVVAPPSLAVLLEAALRGLGLCDCAAATAAVLSTAAAMKKFTADTTSHHPPGVCAPANGGASSASVSKGAGVAGAAAGAVQGVWENATNWLGLRCLLRHVAAAARQQQHRTQAARTEAGAAAGSSSSNSSAVVAVLAAAQALWLPATASHVERQQLLGALQQAAAGCGVEWQAVERAQQAVAWPVAARDGAGLTSACPLAAVTCAAVGEACAKVLQQNSQAQAEEEEEQVEPLHLHLPPLQQQEVGATLVELHGHLATHGLVLLLGPSGAGKSLALRVLAAAYDQLASEGAMPLLGGLTTTRSSSRSGRRQTQPRIALVTAFPDAWHIPHHAGSDGSSGAPLAQLLRHHCQAALRGAHGAVAGGQGVGDEEEGGSLAELQGLGAEDGSDEELDWAAAEGLGGNREPGGEDGGSLWLLVLDGPVAHGSVTSHLLQQLLLGWPLGSACGVWLQQAWGLPPGCCGVVVESGGVSRGDLPSWLVPAAPAVVLHQALVAHQALLLQRLQAVLHPVQVLPKWPSEDGCSCCSRQAPCGSSSSSSDGRQDQPLLLEVPADLHLTLLGLLQDLAAVAAQQQHRSHQDQPHPICTATTRPPATSTPTVSTDTHQGTGGDTSSSSGSSSTRPHNLAMECSQAAMLSDVLAVAGAMWRVTTPTSPAEVRRMAPRVVLAAATWLLAGRASASSPVALTTLQQAWAGVCAGAGLGDALPPQGQLLQHCLCLGCGEWRSWGEATQQWAVLGGALALQAEGEDLRGAWQEWGTPDGPVLVDTPVGLLVVSQRGAALHHLAWWGMAAGRRLVLAPSQRSAEQLPACAPAATAVAGGTGGLVGCSGGAGGGLSSPESWVSAAMLALQLSTGRPVPHAQSTAAVAAAAAAGWGCGAWPSASQQRLLSRLTLVDPGVLRLLPAGAAAGGAHSPRGHGSCLGPASAAPAAGAAGQQGSGGSASCAIVDEAGVLQGLVEDALSRLPTVSSLSPAQLSAALLGLYNSLAAAGSVTAALAAMGQLEPAAQESLVVGRLVEGRLEPALCPVPSTQPTRHPAAGPTATTRHAGGSAPVQHPAATPAALACVPPLTPGVYGRMLSLAVSSVTTWRADPVCPAAGRAWLRWEELALALVDAAVGAWLEGGALTAAGLGLMGCGPPPVAAAPGQGRSKTPTHGSSSSSSSSVWPVWWLGFRNIVVLLVTSALSSAVAAARGGASTAPALHSSSPPPGAHAQASPLGPLKPHYQRALAASVSHRGDWGGVELTAATWLLLLEAHGSSAAAALRELLQGGVTSRLLQQLGRVAALGRDALLSWEPLQVGVARQELVGMVGAGVEAGVVAAGGSLEPTALAAQASRLTTSSSNWGRSRSSSRRNTSASWRSTGEVLGPEPALSPAQLQRLCQLLPWDAWVAALTRLMWRLEGGAAAAALLATGPTAGGGVCVPGPMPPNADGSSGAAEPWGAAAARHASVGGAPEPLVRPMSRMAAGPAPVTVLLGASSWDRQCAAALAAAAMCAPLVALSPATASTWGDLLMVLAGVLSEEAAGAGAQQLVVLLVGRDCCTCPVVMQQLQRLATRGLTSRPTQVIAPSPGSPEAYGVALEQAASLAVHLLLDVEDAGQAAAAAAAAPELWAAASSWVAPPVSPATAQQDMGAELLREAQPLVLALHAAQQEAAGMSRSHLSAAAGASRSPSPTHLPRLGGPRPPLRARRGVQQRTSQVELSTPELQQLAGQVAAALLEAHTAASRAAAQGSPLTGGPLLPSWHHLQQMMVLAPVCYAAARRPLLLQRRQLAQAVEALQQLEAAPSNSSGSSRDSTPRSGQGVDTPALLSQLRAACAPQVPHWRRQLAQVEGALAGLVPLCLVAAAQQVLLPLVLAAWGAAGFSQDKVTVAAQQLVQEWRQAVLGALSLEAAGVSPHVTRSTTWGNPAQRVGDSWWHGGCPSVGELLGVMPPAADALAGVGLTGVTPGAVAAAAAVRGTYLSAVAAWWPVLVADPLHQVLPLLMPHPVVQQAVALQGAPDGGLAGTPLVVTHAGQHWMLLSAAAISRHPATAGDTTQASSCSSSVGDVTMAARRLLRQLQPHLASGGAVVVLLSGDTEEDAAAAATLAALHWLLGVAQRLAAAVERVAEQEQAKAQEQADSDSRQPEVSFSLELGVEADEAPVPASDDPTMAAIETVLLSTPPPPATAASTGGAAGGCGAGGRLLLVAPRESHRHLLAAPRLHEVATCVSLWQWPLAVSHPAGTPAAGPRPQPQAQQAAPVGQVPTLEVEPLVVEAVGAAVLAAAQPATRKCLERAAAAAAAAAESCAAEEQQLLQRLAQVTISGTSLLAAPGLVGSLATCSTQLAEAQGAATAAQAAYAAAVAALFDGAADAGSMRAAASTSCGPPNNSSSSGSSIQQQLGVTTHHVAALLAALQQAGAGLLGCATCPAGPWSTWQQMLAAALAASAPSRPGSTPGQQQEEEGAEQGVVMQLWQAARLVLGRCLATAAYSAWHSSLVAGGAGAVPPPPALPPWGRDIPPPVCLTATAASSQARLPLLLWGCQLAQVVQEVTAAAAVPQELLETVLGGSGYGGLSHGTSSSHRPWQVAGPLKLQPLVMMELGRGTSDRQPPSHHPGAAPAPSRPSVSTAVATAAAHGGWVLLLIHDWSHSTQQQVWAALDAAEAAQHRGISSSRTARPWQLMLAVCQALLPVAWSALCGRVTPCCATQHCSSSRGLDGTGAPAAAAASAGQPFLQAASSSSRLAGCCLDPHPPAPGALLSSWLALATHMTRQASSSSSSSSSSSAAEQEQAQHLQWQLLQPLGVALCQVVLQLQREAAEELGAGTSAPPLLLRGPWDMEAAAQLLVTATAAPVAHAVAAAPTQPQPARSGRPSRRLLDWAEDALPVRLDLPHLAQQLGWALLGPAAASAAQVGRLQAALDAALDHRRLGLRVKGDGSCRVRREVVMELGEALAAAASHATDQQQPGHSGSLSRASSYCLGAESSCSSMAGSLLAGEEDELGVLGGAGALVSSQLPLGVCLTAAELWLWLQHCWEPAWL